MGSVLVKVVTTENSMLKLTHFSQCNFLKFYENYANVFTHL